MKNVRKIDSKIIIADSNEIFLEGIKSALISKTPFKSVKKAVTGEQLQKHLEASNILIAIVEIDLLLENNECLVAKYPGVKFIVLIEATNEKDVSRILHVGSYACISKNISIADFLKAFTTVLKGEKYYCPSISRLLAEMVIKKKESVLKDSAFSTTELTLFKLLSKGLTSKEIAPVLKLTTRTVEDYKCKLQAKTKARNTVELVIYAIKKQIVSVKDL